MTAAFTIAVWMNPTLDLGDNPLVSKLVGSHRDIVLRYQSSGQLQAHFTVGNGLLFLQSANGIVAEDVWQHAALTWDGSVMTLYLDGEVVATNTFVTGPSISANGQFSIGSLTSTGGEAMRGAVDDVLITSYAATAEQVNCIMNGSGPATDGLVLHMPLNGNTLDVSSTGNSGTMSNIQSAADRFYAPASAYSFASNSSQILFNNHPAYAPMANAFTVTAWVYPTAQNGNRTIVSKIGSGRDFVFNIIDGKLSAHFFVGSFYWCNSTTANVPLNQWSHVALVWDGDRMSVHVNAQEVHGADFPTQGPVISSNSVRIGNLSGGGEAFSGRIDDVKFWTRALSPCELDRENHARIDLFVNDELTVCIGSVPEVTSDVTMCDYSWPGGVDTESYAVPTSVLGEGTHPIALTAFDSYGRQQRDTLYVTVELCVGVDETEAADLLTIAPNPTTDVVTVSGFDVASIQVFALDGRMVAQSTRPTVDLSALPTGVYTLNILSPQGELIHRKVVKNG
jgi:hypothetical protein